MRRSINDTKSFLEYMIKNNGYKLTGNHDWFSASFLYKGVATSSCDKQEKLSMFVTNYRV